MKLVTQQKKMIFLHRCKQTLC